MLAYLMTCLLFAPAPIPKPMDGPGPDGVYARCQWQPAAALRVGAHHYIYRDGNQLAEALKLKGDSAAEAASALLAQRFGVQTIDWRKQMIVTLTAGLKGADADRLTIVRAVRKDQTLTIYYTLHVEQPAPDGDKTTSAPKAQGFGCPAESVLIDRFDGAIKLEMEK